MQEFFYKGIWRMDWGLGSPNNTAGLIAILMVAVCALAYIRRWGFWLAITLFSGLGVCLIHTFSRGGVIALFAGMAVVLWNSPRPWPRSRIMAAVVAFWTMIGATLFLEAHGRFFQGVVQEDRSITNRLEIWKMTPRMMVDAPSGWGLGNAAKAYMHWYQSVDRPEEYRTLVNSHLVWLVEFGWIGRFLYLLGWLSVFLICWPSKENRWLAIPFAVWVCFAVAAFFSSVAESPWLWIVPAICLAVAVIIRVARKLYPTPRQCLLVVTSVLVLAAALFVVGMATGGSIRIRQTQGRLVIGESAEPQIWLVADVKTMGKSYGKTLRRLLADPASGVKTVGLAPTVLALGDVTGKTVVLAGSLDDDGKAAMKHLTESARKVILLAPAYYPQELNLTKADAEKVDAVFGEFSQSPTVRPWGEVAHLRRIEGAGDFLPNWVESVFNGKQ